MRLQDALAHPRIHAALTNVGVSQHHLRPQNVEVLNITQAMYPVPFGPNVWDIAMPFDAQVVVFSLRSLHTTELGGAKSGVYGIANRSPIQASTVSIGGEGSIGSTSYNAIYSKVSGALNLSHKVFGATGANVSLTNTYLELTGPTTRVLRTWWENYSAGLDTLKCWGDVGVLG
jgi:hypothetical protein